jgi:prepilin peptidase CpaA
MGAADMLIAGVIVHALLVLVTVVAAVLDWRTGLIPNWLTYPLIVLGPVFWLVFDLSTSGELYLVYWSLAGIVGCAIVPLIMWNRKAMGGGDVKLFMGIGAVGTLPLGIEAQLLAFMAGAVFTLGRLAWNGKFFRTVGNAFYLGLNPVLPKKWRKEISPELMTMVRFGGAIALGTSVAVLMAYDRLWL